MPEGPTGAPDSDELRITIAAVVAQLEPDQIVLFGSAARGEMTEHSDLDLLVIKEPNGQPGGRHHRLNLENTRHDVDILLSTRAAAEAGREYAGDVHGIALETGRTVYTRRGFKPLETGPTHILDGTTMVRKTLFKPDHAHEFLARAERKWAIAGEPHRHPADRCEMLQAAMEQALKGLTIAQGRQIAHRHDLDRLWQDAERDGERIGATRHKDDLDRLTLYAGIYQYWNPTPGMPEKTWNATKDAGRDVLAHARTRIPTLVEETNERLKEPGTPGAPRGAGSPTGGHGGAAKKPN